MIDLLVERLPGISMAVSFENIVSEPRAVLLEVVELCEFSADEGAIPTLGDYRGCAEPYAELMDAASKK